MGENMNLILILIVILLLEVVPAVIIVDSFIGRQEEYKKRGYEIVESDYDSVLSLLSETLMSLLIILCPIVNYYLAFSMCSQLSDDEIKKHIKKGLEKGELRKINEPDEEVMVGLKDDNYRMSIQKDYHKLLNAEKRQFLLEELEKLTEQIPDEEKQKHL